MSESLVREWFDDIENYHRRVKAAAREGYPTRQCRNDEAHECSGGYPTENTGQVSPIVPLARVCRPVSKTEMLESHAAI